MASSKTVISTTTENWKWQTEPEILTSLELCQRAWRVEISTTNKWEIFDHNELSV